MHNSLEERFKVLYQKMVQAIYRYVYYKCGDKELARDITQDVFVKCWDKLDTIIEGAESPYLYQIAKNLLINRSEKRKVVLKFGRTMTDNTTIQSPQYLLEEKEFKERLENAISQLPETQREVLLMHRIDGLKYKEIAQRLDISQKAVEKRMHLALVVLRKIHKNI